MNIHEGNGCSSFPSDITAKLERTQRTPFVLPTKSDSDVIFCLQVLSKTLTCALHLSNRKLIDHFCINPILRIGLIHK